MKILINSSVAKPHIPDARYQGIERLCREFALELNSLGHMVTVTAPEGSIYPEIIEVIKVATGGAEAENESFPSWKHRLGDFDIIHDFSHLHAPALTTAGLPALNVFWHDPHLAKFMEPGYNMIGLSEYAVESFREIYHQNARHQETIVVDLDRYKPLETFITELGYVFVRLHKTDKYYSMATKYGWASRARLVLAQSLGRPLENHEVVHHMDENKSNDVPSNLLLTTKPEHTRIHRLKLGGKDSKSLVETSSQHSAQSTPNNKDDGMYSPDETPPRINSQSGSQAMKLRFLSLGLMLPLKGHLEAMRLCRKLNVPLDVVGGTMPTDDQSYMQTVEELCIGKIRFWGDVDDDTKIFLMQSARALIYPQGQLEIHSHKSIEAMACGCPVITYDKGAMAEVIGAGGFAVVDEKDFLEAMTTVVTYADAFAIDARKWASKWHIHKVVADYLPLYKDVANGLRW